MLKNRYNDRLPTPKQPKQPKPPGTKEAIWSLILGCGAIILIFFGLSGVLSIIAGIIGIIFAKKAKRLGYKTKVRLAGLITSIIGLALGGLLLLFVVGGIVYLYVLVQYFGVSPDLFFG